MPQQLVGKQTQDDIILTNAKHPVAWAMLMDELDDARDHLRKLVEQMNSAASIDDEDFAIQLGHVYAHLNRAWHGRDHEALDHLSDEERRLHTQFPQDLEPVG